MIVRNSTVRRYQQWDTDIFDIGTRVDSNHVAVLDSQVVTNDSVDAGTAIIELIISKDDEDCVLSLLASDEDGVTTEELELVHGGLREGNDTVIIVDGIGDPWWCQLLSHRHTAQSTYINWLGFFFFLRIAVATSSSCRMVSCVLETRMESDATNVLDLGARSVAITLLASLLARQERQSL